jgi:hypothetical protein
MAAGMAARLDELWQHVGDPAAKPKFDARLEIPALRTLLAPRMVTNSVADPQAYFQDMCRYTNAELAASITCPSFVTDNETDLVSTGQGRQLYDEMTCPKTFRRCAEGAEGHCEGMAPISLAAPPRSPRCRSFSLSSSRRMHAWPPRDPGSRSRREGRAA